MLELILLIFGVLIILFVMNHKLASIHLKAQIVNDRRLYCSNWQFIEIHMCALIIEFGSH